MPIRARFGLRRRKRSSRREWLAHAAVNNSIAAGTLLSIQMAPPSTLDEFQQGTLLRMRGVVVVSPATSPAVATGYAVFMGIAMLGPFEVWDPETNQDFQWFWHQAIFPQVGGSGAADNNSSRWAGYFHIPIDVVRMAKIQEARGLVLAIKNSALSGAAIQVTDNIRMLVLAGH